MPPFVEVLLVREKTGSHLRLSVPREFVLDLIKVYPGWQVLVPK